MGAAASLLISIRPRHVRGIMAGTKTAELRRQRPRVESGGRVYVYTASPSKRLEATFQVTGILTAAPSELWDEVKSRAGVTRNEFFRYFRGAHQGTALLIGTVRPLARPLPLDELRDRIPGFHPPQMFRYLTEADLICLAIDHASGPPCRLRLAS